MRGLRFAAAMGLLIVAAPVSGANPEKQENEDPVTCKKIQEIGSLVKKRKVCKPASEWRKFQDGARATTQSLQDGNSRLAEPPQ